MSSTRRVPVINPESVLSNQTVSYVCAVGTYTRSVTAPRLDELTVFLYLASMPLL